MLETIVVRNQILLLLLHSGKKLLIKVSIMGKFFFLSLVSFLGNRTNDFSIKEKKN